MWPAGFVNRFVASRKHRIVMEIRVESSVRHKAEMEF